MKLALTALFALLAGFLGFFVHAYYKLSSQNISSVKQVTYDNGISGKAMPFDPFSWHLVSGEKEDLERPGFLILAFSKDGCNLCMEDILNSYRELERKNIPLFVLAFGELSSYKGKARGFVAENPDIPFLLTEEVPPAEWNNLMHPRLLYYEGHSRKFVMDFELNVSHTEKMDWIKHWISNLNED